MRHEVEVDTKLAELHGHLSKLRVEMAATRLSLASALGIRPYYETRTRREVRETIDELLALAETTLARAEMTPWARESIERNVARWHEQVAERVATLAEMKPLDDEFFAQPWSRFFLVQNHGGHIHSSMDCSTCRPTTSFAWLPTLSGLTEKDAVEEHGPLLCTVCYPSAPVEWTVGLPAADDNCAGSGSHPANPNRRRYLACPTCGESVSVTSTGKLRAHKAKVTS